MYDFSFYRSIIFLFYYYICIFIKWLLKGDRIPAKNDKTYNSRYNQIQIYLLDELRMHLWIQDIRKKIASGIVIFLFLFAFLRSDNVFVGFSDFKFLSWSEEMDTLHLQLSWWETREFSVILYNKEDIDKTYKLWFVDVGTTNDALAQAACLWPNEISTFWRFVTWDTTEFTLAPWWTGMRTLSLRLPETYSWTYTWCIIFSPANVGSDTVTTEPRKGIFISASVTASALPIIVKAFPSNRIYQASNNANIATIKIYDMEKNPITSSNPFTLSSGGTGQAYINITNGTYYVVLKWQSHLASYLSWVDIWWLGWEILDFTTGTNLYGTQQLTSLQDDGNRYQTAGDLKNTLGDYDYIINGNDISIITKDGINEWEIIDVLDPRNLNGDSSFDVSDISVIGTNFDRHDPFYTGPGFTASFTR